METTIDKRPMRNEKRFTYVITLSLRFSKYERTRIDFVRRQRMQRLSKDKKYAYLKNCMWKTSKCSISNLLTKRSHRDFCCTLANSSRGHSGHNLHHSLKARCSLATKKWLPCHFPGCSAREHLHLRLPYQLTYEGNKVTSKSISKSFCKSPQRWAGMNAFYTMYSICTITCAAPLFPNMSWLILIR